MTFNLQADRHPVRRKPGAHHTRRRARLVEGLRHPVPLEDPCTIDQPDRDVDRAPSDRITSRAPRTVRPAATIRWRSVGVGEAPERRLEPGQTRDRRRGADRSGAVGPGRQRTNPDARAADVPPDEPPGLRSRFHGLGEIPNVLLSVSARHVGLAKQDVARDPLTLEEHAVALRGGAPAWRNRSWSGSPAASLSFSAMGTPSSGPDVLASRDALVDHRRVGPTRSASMAQNAL